MKEYVDMLNSCHQEHRLFPSKNRGFTLVELMVTLAVLAILVKLALPNYSNFVAKSRRTEATTQLLQIGVLQEQFFRDFRGYAAGSSATGSAPTSPNYLDGKIAWAAPTNAYFDYTIALDTAGTTNDIKRMNFVATADGKSGTTVDKYTYAINSVGIRCLREDSVAVGLTATATACPSGSTVW